MTCHLLIVTDHLLPIVLYATHCFICYPLFYIQVTELCGLIKENDDLQVLNLRNSSIGNSELQDISRALIGQRTNKLEVSVLNLCFAVLNCGILRKKFICNCEGVRSILINNYSPFIRRERKNNSINLSCFAFVINILYYVGLGYMMSTAQLLFYRHIYINVINVFFFNVITFCWLCSCDFNILDVEFEL